MGDSLNRILADAAPATNARLAGEDIRAIVRGTRRAARARAGRSTRVGVIAGLTALLMGGGAVAALANDDVRDWFFSGLQDPYVTVQYTAPSGALCT